MGVSLLIGVSLSFMACSENDPATVDPPESTQLLANPSVEEGTTSPNDWYPGSDWDGPQNAANDYALEWSSDAASSGQRSLKISLSAINDPNHFANWGQPLRSGLPHGEHVKLKAFVKTSVVGDGVAIMLGGDSGNVPIFGSTTEGDRTITGDLDWHAVELDLGVVPAEVDIMYVLLIMLPGTTGEVYFDDITLDVVAP